MNANSAFLAAVACALVMTTATGCSGSGSDANADNGASTDSAATAEATSDSSNIRVVSVEEGAEILANAPDDLVVLDVRTAEEFAEGHLEGAIMIDFYRDDFAEELAKLDPNVPYLLYCRSGNRSEQARAIMEDIGFADVADIDGGIGSWTAAGMPTVTG